METTEKQADTLPAILEKQLVTAFPFKDQELMALAQNYSEIRVKDVNDRDGYQALTIARKDLKAWRVKIAKAGKQSREAAVWFQRTIIAREKELIAIIEPTEIALEARENEILADRKRLCEEAERKEAERIQTMIDKLHSLDFALDYMQLKAITDDQFEELVKEVTLAYQDKQRIAAEEQARLKEELRIQEEKRQAEQLRLERERKEHAERQLKFEQEREKFIKEQEHARKDQLERERRIKEEQEKVAAERQALEDQKKRDEELVQARKDAEAKARKDEREKIEKEVAEKAERERRLKEEEQEQLLAGSDSDLFSHLADQTFALQNNEVWKNFKSKKGKLQSAIAAGHIAAALDVLSSNKLKKKKSNEK